MIWLKSGPAATCGSSRPHSISTRTPSSKEPKGGVAWPLRAVFVGTKFGAVVLVSGTLAPIAYANNIDPLHFWMMVLVAFELGYLLPPVAINQLLTRQVIGEEEVTLADNEVKHLGFYRRYERWILPLVVMTIGLVVVSFAPLAVHDFPELKTVSDWFPRPPQ